MGTGIGFGIALPHASSDLIAEAVGGIGRYHQRIAFDSLDGNPVKLVVLFLIPAGEFQRHINTLANIAKLLQRKEYRDGLWGRFM